MKTLNQIIDIIENRGFKIDEYKEDNNLLGYEINTYTYLGVNMIVFLDFRDENKSATSPKDFITEFESYIKDIDIDEEIDTHRQDILYRANFKTSQSLKDFKNWKKLLKGILKQIKKEPVKTKREIAENQIKLQSKIQSAGFNIVTCGSCGSVLLHEVGDEKIQCFCGTHSLSDCPDYWHEGAELSAEFDEN